MQSDKYQEFLINKAQRPAMTGFDIAPDALNPMLYSFQRAIVSWALRLGKSAIFAEVGLGKTGMQLEWANRVASYTDAPVLILAPLAVSHQTIREGQKFGIEAVYRPDGDSILVSDRIVVTNYERLEKFDLTIFSGVVLDEASVLKNYTGKTKQAILEAFADTPFKLSCSATPAPNDYLELGNQAEFLSVKTASEMLSIWFINDLKSGEWRLKGHAEADYWRWLTSWAVCIQKPSDLGQEYKMDGYDLPELHLIGHYLNANETAIKDAWGKGKLLPDTAPSSTELGKVKRLSLSERLEKAKEIVAAIPENEPILIWAILNDETKALMDAFKHLGAVEVKGSDKPESKAEKLLGFSDGKYRILITKASIAGFGMNWQHCNQVIFFGFDFSFESFYQAIGRNYRYGQEREVYAHLIYSELEGNVTAILQEKQSLFKTMQSKMVAAMRKHGLIRQNEIKEINFMSNRTDGKNWSIIQGDCVNETKQLADNSTDLSIFSPPFSDWFTFSDSPLDMSNVADNEEFYTHFAYLIPELYRVMKAGRVVAVHIKDMPVHKSKEGYMGLHDMSGELIRMFEFFNRPAINPPDLTGLSGTEAYVELLNWQRTLTASKSHDGFRFAGRFTIWKDPEMEMLRTKSHALLYKNYQGRAEVVRNGLADYILLFRKWDSSIDSDDFDHVIHTPEIGSYIGTNPPSQVETFGDVSRTPNWNWGRSEWARYASPVWWDIDQQDTLNIEQARSKADSKHIVALQLQVIERLIYMYSNEGETVFSPFAGIGSEIVSAIKLRRKGIGIELKQQYVDHAVKNCTEAERKVSQKTLWDYAEENQKA